jgi:hypothetical protein
LRAVAAAALLVMLAACGGGERADAHLGPSVPTELVPEALESGKLRVIQNEADSTKKAFQRGGAHVLIADGGLWEIRDGQRLVGALEVATVKNRVNLARRKVRRTIVRNVMPARMQRLDVGDLTVYSTKSNDKIVYMWFGKKSFQILQLKGSALDPEALLNEIVEYQTSSDDKADLLLLNTAD